MCVSRNSRIIISGKIGDSNWLKCFNTKGDFLWQIQMGKGDNGMDVIQGLCCVPTTNEYLIVTLDKRIEF